MPELQALAAVRACRPGRLSHALTVRRCCCNEYADKYALTPLHYAAGAADEASVISNLMDAGQASLGYIDVPDSVGRTPLFFAVLSSSRPCAEALIKCASLDEIKFSLSPYAHAVIHTFARTRSCMRMHIVTRKHTVPYLPGRSHSQLPVTHAMQSIGPGPT